MPVTFLERLNEILQDLSEHKTDRNDLYTRCVNERLTKSVATYYQELTESFQYLETKDPLSLSRKLNKE